jgi:ParB-like chromosome segregation protein Spo0J
LKPYPGNPRIGDTDAIVESIRANGFYTPLVVTSDHYIIKGNHSYAAGMELGMDEFPCVVRDYPHDTAAARRVVLADNHTSDLGKGYEIGDLLALLRVVEAEDGLYGTTFASDDLDDLIARVQEDLTTPLDFGGAVGHDPTLAEKFDRYTATGRRMIVLDYDQETYIDVTVLFGKARAAHGVESNAEAALAVMREMYG